MSAVKGRVCEGKRERGEVRNARPVLFFVALTSWAVG